VKGISTEAKVGLLVLLSMFILAFLTFRSGKMTFDKGKGYQLKVKFNSVAGLDPKARVKVSGVDAGYVREINLVHGYPELTLWIGPDIEIREDAVAWVRSLGMMGEKYVEIEPGSLSYPLLKDGDNISRGLVAKDVDDIRGDIVAISSHGVSPQLEKELRARHINIINTTCPFVHRAHVAARRLAKAGFFVIVYELEQLA